MKLRHPKSIIIIFIYVLINIVVIAVALTLRSQEITANANPQSMAPEFTEIENLDYFHLKNGVPQMSLAADKMRSQGEDIAEFSEPKGVYNYQAKNQTIRYKGHEGIYKKAKDFLSLKGDVRVVSDEAEYTAQRLKYYFTKDLIVGQDEVHFKADDLKTKDHLEIEADTLKAQPQAQVSLFKGNVRGFLQRKKKYEGKMTFSSQQFQMEGLKSLAHLEGDVVMKRDNYLITGGKADIHLENYNKSLKYFVMNDDVKMTETLHTPQGVSQRKAFAERLEGFGREQKMVLSGAPKVEHGADVIKGYRITIRENVDLIEVDDAMSDMQMKREKKPKEQ